MVKHRFARVGPFYVASNSWTPGAPWYRRMRVHFGNRLYCVVVGGWQVGVQW